MKLNINLSRNARKVILAMVLLGKQNKKKISFNDLVKQERVKGKKTFVHKGLHPTVASRGINELMEYTIILSEQKYPRGDIYLINPKFTPACLELYKWYEGYAQTIEDINKFMRIKKNISVKIHLKEEQKKFFNTKSKTISFKLNLKKKESELFEKFIKK